MLGSIAAAVRPGGLTFFISSVNGWPRREEISVQAVGKATSPTCWHGYRIFHPQTSPPCEFDAPQRLSMEQCAPARFPGYRCLEPVLNIKLRPRASLPPRAASVSFPACRGVDQSTENSCRLRRKRGGRNRTHLSLVNRSSAISVAVL